jgi:ADP-heptose:LPS heptosyltransferase
VGERILIIKLGALGDVVQALGAVTAIRRHHAGAHITALTTPLFAPIFSACPDVNETWTEDRPRAWQIGTWLALRRRLRDAGFSRVYDLQTSGRSSLYFHLLGPGARPEWSGIARGCSHPDADPARNAKHDLDRQRDQLAAAGITRVPEPDLGWMPGGIDPFDLPARIALLAPGSAPHRRDKRWPVAHFAALARGLTERGLAPVVVGGADEREIGRALARDAGARDLTGQTTFGELVALARAAGIAVGNDTGPMHLIAAAGCRSVVLFSRASDPALCAPRGRAVSVLRRPDLADLAPAEVLRATADA